MAVNSYQLAAAKPRGKCRHCVRRKAAPARKGLCHTCSLVAEIRTRYASTSPYGTRGVGAGNAARRPSYPTAALAGSREKMRVMHERALRGESLFHPDDCSDVRCESPFEGLHYRGGSESNGLEWQATSLAAI